MADRPKPGSGPAGIPVRFQPMGTGCRVEPGTTIAAAARRHGIELRSDCGGQGTCGQCLVDIAPVDGAAAPTDPESTLLGAERIERGGRLACQAKVIAPLAVSVAEAVLDSQEAVGKGLSGAIETGDRPARADGGASGALGLAIDIGTTTLACYLCDLNSARILASAAEANPQRRFGEDVISRIAYANEHTGGLAELRDTLVTAINALIGRCLAAAGARRHEVEAVTALGNTTMQHLFTGLHPRRLGVSPYMPQSRAAGEYRAADLGLELDPACPVHVFPVISGFVGGDTVGVMLAETPYLRDEVSLIIDIGTNGEIVLGNRDGLWVTSCATGPALEGAHIQCGMRAAAGAIEKVVIDPATHRADWELIGGAAGERPRGLCGSGIIDAVAEMLRSGLILPSGRLREGLPGVVADDAGIGRKFVLVPADARTGQAEIALTLTDIRQVQLAKAALATGIKLLVQQSGIERFDRLVLTGAFGARFNWRNAVTIGMLPEAARRAAVVTVDNAAGRGALAALVDRRRRREIAEVAERANLLELAEHPDFVLEFSQATMFPETPD